MLPELSMAKTTSIGVMVDEVPPSPVTEMVTVVLVLMDPKLMVVGETVFVTVGASVVSPLPPTPAGTIAKATMTRAITIPKASTDFISFFILFLPVVSLVGVDASLSRAPL
jgi:hypothetical protein